MARDTIAIRGLRLDAVVGVYPNERDTPQPLALDLEIALDTEQAAVRERLSRTVDYHALCQQIVFLLQSCKFRLIETAAHTLARYLLAPPAAGERRAQIESLRLRLSKPEALDGVAVPSVEIERPMGWVTLIAEEKPFGTVDVVHETQDAGIYRLNVAPGREIPLHVHRRMQESEMVLGDGLLCQGAPCPPGTVHRWPLDTPHTYANPTDQWQTILCVDSPPFMEDDEIVVTGGPVGVEPELVWP
jgi:dihydroneopterin aldolase